MSLKIAKIVTKALSVCCFVSAEKQATTIKQNKKKENFEKMVVGWLDFIHKASSALEGKCGGKGRL
jgi:hypothetical protein